MEKIMRTVKRFIPITTRIKIEVIKDENLDLTSKYRYNPERKQHEELSSSGFVISAVTNSQYEELKLKEGASGQLAVVRYIGGMSIFNDSDTEINVGDTVLVTRNAGHNQKYSDTDKVYRFITENDIIAVQKEVKEND